MSSFTGVDYLDFDSVLSDEEKLRRNTTRQFVDDQIMPIIEEYNREGKFPRGLRKYLDRTSPCSVAERTKFATCWSSCRLSSRPKCVR
jgi:hypothetical protein